MKEIKVGTKFVFGEFYITYIIKKNQQILI